MAQKLMELMTSIGMIEQLFDENFLRIWLFDDF